jgi:hypothetical protein
MSLFTVTKKRYLLFCSVNVAFDKEATSNNCWGGPDGGEACKAVNGRTSPIFNATNCFHSRDGNPWWEVNLGQTYGISGISIRRREGDGQNA